MPLVQVDISPAVIDWVLKNTDNMDTKAEVIDNLHKWKSGEKKPTFNQIELVSKATNIPLGYFFLQQPPVEDFPVLQYRTIDSMYTKSPSRDVVDTLNYMESIQEWMRNYMLDNDYDKLHFVGSVKETVPVATIANNIRKVLGIDIDWYKQVSDTVNAFKFFRRKLESIGMLVMMSGIVGNNTRRSLNIDEFRAFTLIDNYAPLVFINANDSNGAKLFSLLHECAHVWLGKDNFYNDSYSNENNINPIEILCNAISAELLVPNDLFKHEWTTRINDKPSERIRQVSYIFRCGAVVIARRAYDNQYINKNDYQSVVNEAIEQFKASRKNKPSGGDYYATTATRIDNRFIIALDYSIKEGKTLFTDAYRLTNTNRKTFPKLVEQVRGISQ